MSNEPQNPFYIEIARISAILLASVIAMMVFMLIVGVQSPATNIKLLLFIALISLGATLVVGVLGNILEERSVINVTGLKKSGAKDLKLRSAKISKRLGIFRLFQQVVFVVSIVSTVLLALAVIQFLYKPAPSPASQQSGASSGQQPEESAEDHAKEGSAAPQNQPASPSPTP